MTRNEIIKNLEGVICPVATPFNRRGEVDKGQFLENISKISGIGLAGILVAGSTGEAPYLTEDERLRLVEMAREVVKPPEILLAGTGLESTAATIKLSREAVARGADALLVLTPNYYKARMDSDALVAHYRAVGAGVKRPVMVYSIPQFTGLDVDPATIGKLSRLPNVVGLKESSGKHGLFARHSVQSAPGVPGDGGFGLHILRGVVRRCGGSGAGPGQFCPVALCRRIRSLSSRECRSRRVTCSNAFCRWVRRLLSRSAWRESRLPSTCAAIMEESRGCLCCPSPPRRRNRLRQRSTKLTPDLPSKRGA